MIVRDEEASLPNFFRAVQGLWDELCVVDTGSNDKTVELVKMAGGRLQTILWNDDFSFARNVSLQMASSDWILVLDADELPSASLISSARAQLAQTHLGAALVPFVASGADGQLQRVHRLRLFKRHCALRYRFAVYEDIVGVTRAYLRRSRLRCARLAGHVEHLGEATWRQTSKDVRRRDARLIEAILEQDPRSLHGVWAKLVHQTRWRGPSAARAHIPAAQMALEAASVAQRQTEAGRAEALLRCVAHLEATTSVGAALQRLVSWQRQIRPTADYHLARGRLQAALKQPAAAAEDFERALSMARGALDVDNAAGGALLGLASLCQQQKKWPQAQKLVFEALACDARCPRALAALLDVSQSLAGATGVRRAMHTYLAHYGWCPELAAVHQRHGLGAPA